MWSRFRRFNWLGEALLGLLYPPSVSCPLCGKSSGSFHPAREVVCQRCQTAIAKLQANLLRCHCCGRFFRQTEKPVAAAPDWCCAGCLKSRPDFDFARAVGPYAGVLREAVHMFKYLGKLSLAEPLGKLMAAAIREEFQWATAGGQPGSSAVGAADVTRDAIAGAAGSMESGASGVASATRDAAAGATRNGAAGGGAANQSGRGAAGPAGIGMTGAACVVPVPLHPQRLRERGFNQAELLAEVVARELKLEFAPGMLARSKHTSSQTRLSREKRQLNLRGAFVLGSGHVHSGSPKSASLTNQAGLSKPAALTNKKSSPDHAVLPNQAVLIVDDVLTTGSTGTECARVLRQVTCGPIVLVTTATGGNFR